MSTDPTISPVTTFLPIETGCIIDGHHGIYIYQYICELAQSYGWRLKEDHDSGHIECSELAIEWLNEQCKEKECRFGWYDGEFFYQTNEWWANEG